MEAVMRHEYSAPGPHGDVPVRLHGLDATASPRSVVLWVHGGQHLGSAEQPSVGAAFAARIAESAGALTASIDYRLGDEAPYPVPLDDVSAAWDLLIGLLPELGVHDAVLAIGGADLGASLAVATAMRARDGRATPADMLLLASPLVHFPPPAAPDDVLRRLLGDADAVRFHSEAFEAYLKAHLGRISDIPAGVAPGNFDPHGMPPTAIFLRELDEFSPSGSLYARQLAEADVPVAVRWAAGAHHGSIDLAPESDLAGEALEFFIDQLATAQDSRHGSR